MRPAAYVVQRANQIKDVGLADGVARPQGADQLPFGSPPAVGDALYLGFDEPIGRLLIAVDVDASQARGAGVNPEDPPLRWEVSQGDNGWAEAEVLEDLTGGFNYGSGTVELQLPERSGDPVARRPPDALAALPDRRPARAHGGAATTYSHPPEIYSITAVPIGALLPGTHASRVEDELLGLSDGTPGQVFPLRHKPVLKPGVGETLEVQDPESGDWSTWELREDFVGSTEFDRHFVLDQVSGEVEIGPAIRETDGGWTQYGAVPPKGAVLRFARYRHGGGRRGNVSAGALAVLRSTIPGVDTVTNPLTADRRRRRRGARARAPARLDGDPHALPRRHRRGLRVPRRRGVAARRARGLHPAGRGRRRAAAHRPARLPRRPPAPLRRARARRGAAAGGRGLPRRAPPDRHDRAARAVQVPRALGRRQPAGVAARGHRARRGGRRARALHVPQPARRRLGRRARARAGRSAARSTRASSTASSTRSTASSS